MSHPPIPHRQVKTSGFSEVYGPHTSARARRAGCASLSAAHFLPCSSSRFPPTPHTNTTTLPDSVSSSQYSRHPFMTGASEVEHHNSGRLVLPNVSGRSHTTLRTPRPPAAVCHRCDRSTPSFPSHGHARQPRRPPSSRQRDFIILLPARWIIGRPNTLPIKAT